MFPTKQAVIVELNFDFLPMLLKEIVCKTYCQSIKFNTTITAYLPRHMVVPRAAQEATMPYCEYIDWKTRNETFTPM